MKTLIVQAPMFYKNAQYNNQAFDMLVSICKHYDIDYDYITFEEIDDKMGMYDFNSEYDSYYGISKWMNYNFDIKKFRKLCFEFDCIVFTNISFKSAFFTKYLIDNTNHPNCIIGGVGIDSIGFDFFDIDAKYYSTMKEMFSKEFNLEVNLNEVDYNIYSKHDSTITFTRSTGCYNKCKYCLRNETYKSFFDITNVLKFIQPDTKKIMFNDSVTKIKDFENMYFSNSLLTKHISELYISPYKNISDSMNLKLYEIFKDKINFSIGMETGSEDLRSRLGKPIINEAYYEFFKTFKNHIHISFINGSVSETFNDFKQSCNTIQYIKSNFKNVSITIYPHMLIYFNNKFGINIGNKIISNVWDDGYTNYKERIRRYNILQGILDETTY